MTAAVVGPLAAGDPARYAALAAALALVVGGLCLLARVARLGFLADLLSKPVLVGYLAGIAVLMIVSQLGKVTGVPVTGDSPLGGGLRRSSAGSAAAAATACSPQRCWRSCSSSTRLFPRAPAPLIGMLLAAAVVGAVRAATSRGSRSSATSRRAAPAAPARRRPTDAALPAAGRSA